VSKINDDKNQVNKNVKHQKTNFNELNSKSQTYDPAVFVPNGILTDGKVFRQQ
jgi:hypothetical protein